MFRVVLNSLMKRAGVQMCLMCHGTALRAKRLFSILLAEIASIVLRSLCNNIHL